jgi:ribosome-binding ATPase YchF (GTP1/OBG family)
VPLEALEQESIEQESTKKNKDTLISIEKDSLLIVNKYEEAVRSGNSFNKSEAIKHVKHLIRSSEPTKSLLSSVEAYRSKCVKDKIGTKYRYLSSNFFGLKHYKDFIPIKEFKYGEADPECTECRGTGNILAPGSGKIFPCFKCRQKVEV